MFESRRGYLNMSEPVMVILDDLDFLVVFTVCFFGCIEEILKKKRGGFPILEKVNLFDRP